MVHITALRHPWYIENHKRTKGTTKYGTGMLISGLSYGQPCSQWSLPDHAVISELRHRAFVDDYRYVFQLSR
jgi:hypothetical protein